MRDYRIKVTEDTKTKVLEYPDYEIYDKNAQKTNIEVLNDDALTVASEYTFPFVLINASSTKPGGGVWTGAKAQEEDIFRRSSLCSITDDLKTLYPLYNSNKGIYISDAEVLKDTEENGYQDLKKSFIFSAFIIPAQNLSNPKVEFSYKDTLNRIDTILSSALFYHHENLILGAFGCGVFKNDPTIIASIFKKLLDTKFKNVFDNVIFAVLSKNDNNYKIFKEILENE